MKKLYIYSLMLTLSFFGLYVQAQELQWAKIMNSNAYENTMQSIVTDNLGNIYTVGSFIGTVDFDPGQGIFNLSATNSTGMFVTKMDASGQLVWAKAFIPEFGRNITYPSLTIDSYGNIYISGGFNGTVDFNPGLSTFHLSPSGNLMSLPSFEDVFVVKLNNYGNFIWAKAMVEGEGVSRAHSIALDNFGNIYITGTFRGAPDFDPGIGTFNLTSVGSSGIFVVKLNNSGNFIWAKAMVDVIAAHSIVLDNFGNIYMTGTFNGAPDFDPGLDTFNLTSVGGLDCFVSKLDSSGNFVWAKAMGGGQDEQGKSITVDSAGNVYTTGYFGDHNSIATADFDPGLGIYNLTSAGYNDVFVSKLDAFGNFVWAKGIGGAATDFGREIKIDSYGNIFIIGAYSKLTDFDPGASVFNLANSGKYDSFILKLTALGDFVWAKSTGGTGDDHGETIFLNSWGTIYTAGKVEGTVDFDPGAGVVNLTPDWGSTWGLFIQKFCDLKIKATSTNDRICAGSAISLSASGASTYKWIPGNLSGATVSVSPTTTTTYTVTGTSTDGCTNTATKTITVFDVPTPNISSSKTTICQGDSIKLVGTTSAQGQAGIFSNSNPLAIADNNLIGITSTIAVSGISPSTISALTDIQITVNITHPHVGDLYLYLKSPNGTIVTLSEAEGGNGANYAGSTFAISALSSISGGTPPYSGVFAPKGDLTAFIGGLINGNWSLIVADNVAGNVGTLNSWGLKFQNNYSFFWSPAISLSDSASLTPFAKPISNTTYALTISNFLGCTKSTNTNINVIPATTINAQPQDNTICQYQTAKFNCSFAGGVNNGYRWQSKSPTGNWVTINDNSVFSGCATQSLSVLCNDQMNSNYKFRCYVVNTCSVIYSNEALLVVNSPISINKNVSICAGTNHAVGASIYSSPGIYVDTLVRLNGCDSIIKTTLSFYPDIHTLTVNSLLSDTRFFNISCGDIVELEMKSAFSSNPNIQWYPNIALSDPTNAKTFAYPSMNTSYIINYVNNYGCNIADTIDINTNTACLGSIKLLASDTIIDQFDTLKVEVYVNNAVDLFALYPHLLFDNNYLTLVSSFAGSIMGTNTIKTTPVITGNSIDFGITKLNPQSGFSGSGIFYTFYFTPKAFVPDKYNFSFYLNNVNANNSSGQNLDLSNGGQIKVGYTNKVNVWPGDLNSSKSVTVADLLPIGYFYGSTGSIRPNASLTWIAQPNVLWGYDKASNGGSAYKVFADGNGDGIISLADQISVGFNLTQVHAGAIPLADEVAVADILGKQSSPTFSSLPSIAKGKAGLGSTLVSNPQVSIINNPLPQTFVLSIDLSNDVASNDLFGIAFHLTFDPSVIDVSNISYDYAGSVFGQKNIDFISVESTNNIGGIDIGITRYNNSSVSTNGHILTITFNILPTKLYSIPIQFIVEKANDKNGNNVIISESTSYLKISNNAVGINESKEYKVVCIPNPTDGLINLQIDPKMIGSTYSIYDNLGKVALTGTLYAESTLLELGNIAQGIYTLIVGENTNQTFKIVRK